MFEFIKTVVQMHHFLLSNYILWCNLNKKRYIIAFHSLIHPPEVHPPEVRTVILQKVYS